MRRPHTPEAGIDLLAFLRQRDPGLDSVHRAAFLAQPLETFGMGDAAAGSHPVHLAGAHRLLRADAVAVHDLAIEQIGDRGQADVRVRAHVGFCRQARRDQFRAHPVEEDVRTDHAPPREGQHPTDLETAQVAGPLADEKFDHVAPPGCRRRLPWATSSQLRRVSCSHGRLHGRSVPSRPAPGPPATVRLGEKA
jgi:hypothetical protein